MFIVMAVFVPVVRTCLVMRTINAPHRPAGLKLPQHSPQLVGIQPVAAHHSPVQQKHGDIEAMPTLQDGVTVDVDHLDGWQGC
jgi:hypothetical protein